MTLLQLALQRAGYASLEALQRANRLHPSGTQDIMTNEALAPYLFGYRRDPIQPGDTYRSIAQKYGTTERAIAAANPELNPRSLIPGQLLTVPLPFDVVPTQVPFTYEVLQVSTQGLLARYPFLTQQTLTLTDYGRAVTAIRIGVGKRVILYNASHHANEWITTPLVMKFLEQYCHAYIFGEKLSGYSAQELFARCTLYLVPMVNPDGVDLVAGGIGEESFEYRQAKNLSANYPDIPFPNGWKANLNGVDLNLNYPAGWKDARDIKFSQGYTMPGPRDYVGMAPLDQQESAAMARFTGERSPALTISYHTQGEVIYWKYQDIEPAGGREIAAEFARVSGYAVEDVPRASGYAGYKDWFILTYDRPGFTIEAGTGESPLPLSQFDEIYRRNIGILILGLVV